MAPCNRIIENLVIGGNLYIYRNTGTLVWDAEELYTDNEFSREVIVQEIKEMRIVNNCRFEIFYGNEFVLQSILLECSCEAEKKSLIMKLEYEIEALNNSTYKSNFERLIRRKINLINHVYDTNDESRINTHVARTIFQELDMRVIDYQIAKLFYGSEENLEISVKQLIKFIFDEVFKKQEKILSYRFDDSPSLKGDYISHENQMEFLNFRKFLFRKQGEDSHFVKRKREILLNHFIMDVENEYIKPSEFLNHLFSEQNTIMEKNILQEMNKPLSHYYIATSHNTYLTGNQLSSASSEEAYVRVLRQGCRCIELDCWPSQDSIIITHGYTATSKISFESVLRTIKRHAFETTQYPLILSIENHCPVELQKEMARLFVSIFGEMLLTAPLNEEETVLPSPNDLKNRVIIKFAKISEEEDSSSSKSLEEGYVEEDSKDDLDRILRRGFLWVKTNQSFTWETKLFSLFETSLISYEPQSDDEVGENSKSFSYELWYHGTISTERVNEILNSEDNSRIRDGTFFVANVEHDHGFEYLYLFVWKDGEPYPLPINYLNETDEPKFTINFETFNSLEELIHCYMSYSLQINFNKEFDKDFLNESFQLEIKLVSPMYQIDDHTKMEWYHSSLTNEDCNRVMEVVNIKGAFLVRNSESMPGNLTLVFCSSKNVIRRIHLVRRETCFTVGDIIENSFQSVVNLIEFLQFSRSRIYLSYPVTRKMVKEILRTRDKNTDLIYSLENARLPTEPSSLLLENDTELWSFRLTFATNEYLDLGCKARHQAKVWINSIQRVIDRTSQGMDLTEITHPKIAREMSDITVYFQKGNFEKVFHSESGRGIYNQVYSLEEEKMMKNIYFHPERIVDFHELGVTRIYPKGARIKSSNFNPVPFWVYGSQMVALNYQTGDLGMQLNYAWFQQTNNCGCVLRPHVVEDTSNEPIQLEITTLGARVISDNKGRLTPIFLDIELHGIGHDQQCYTTELDGDLLSLSLRKSNPVKHELIIQLPEFAVLQFILYAKNRNYQIGQYTIHVNDIKEIGYRSVPLKNKYSEPLLLSSLLVHIRKWKKIELIQRIEKLNQNLRLPPGSGHHHRRWQKELENAERILKKLEKATKKKKKVPNIKE